MANIQEYPRGAILPTAVTNRQLCGFPSAANALGIQTLPLAVRSARPLYTLPCHISDLNQLLAVQQSHTTPINPFSLEGNSQFANNFLLKPLSQCVYGGLRSLQVSVPFTLGGTSLSIPPTSSHLAQPKLATLTNSSNSVQGDISLEVEGAVPPSDTFLSSKRGPVVATWRGVSRKARENNFPKKLYDIVMNDEYAHIISFDATGRRFCVHNENALESEVLPKHFRHQKFSSFQRQLYIYGFQKVPNDLNVCMYSHPCFQRGGADLVGTIAREKHSEKHSFASMSPREAQLSIASGFVEHKSAFFPNKLYRLLLELEVGGRTGIAQFETKNGFSIQNRELFLEALAKDFKYSSMHSFRRQLSLYGFSRDDVGVYRNPLFVKGRPDLLRDLRRRKDL